MSQGVIQGTIPYLGTFLTDLVMLDTAMKDYLYVSEPGAVGWGRGPEALHQALSSQRGTPHLMRAPSPCVSGHLPIFSPVTKQLALWLVRLRASRVFGQTGYSPSIRQWPWARERPDPPRSGVVAKQGLLA